MWTDWYIAAETEWNYTEEHQATYERYRKNTDYSASKNYFLLQKYWNSLLEHSANTIRVNYFSPLFPRICHRDRKYTWNNITCSKNISYLKFLVYWCSGWIAYASKIRILLHSSQYGGIYNLLSWRISQY